MQLNGLFNMLFLKKLIINIPISVRQRIDWYLYMHFVYYNITALMLCRLTEHIRGNYNAWTVKLDKLIDLYRMNEGVTLSYKVAWQCTELYHT